uniref:EpsG family protein n=1 Tax=Agathobacter sp. TaxID=2021311 RepID=UPI004055F417
MSYVVGIILGICSIFKKKSKYLFGILFLYAWIMFGFNINNPDYWSYRIAYEGFSFTADEPVFILLCNFFRWLHIDYQIFVIIISFVGLILIAKTIMDFSPYPNIVFCLYLIYPFCIDVVQIRSFFAVSLVIYAIRFIINYRLNHEKKNIFLFIIFIILATGFHYSAILYLIIGIQFFEPQKHKFMVYVVVPITFVFFVMNITSFVPVISDVIGSHKTESWVEVKNASSFLFQLRIVIVRGALIVLCIFANHCKKLDRIYYIQKAKILNIQLINEEYASRNECVLNTNRMVNNTFFISIIYILLYIFFEIFLSPQYERMIRPALVLGMILLSRYIYVLEKKNRNILIFFMFMYMILYFINIMYFSESNGKLWFQTVFRMVFENNLLFK